MRIEVEVEASAPERLNRRAEAVRGQVKEVIVRVEDRFPEIEMMLKEMALKELMLPVSEVGVLKVEVGQRRGFAGRICLV